MKTQFQKPFAGKSKYDREYKKEAVEHWKSSGRSAARFAAAILDSLDAASWGSFWHEGRLSGSAIAEQARPS